ncbi:MAG: AsmA-like C-terminal domain-containing protein [Pseudomonadota bacterium]
MGAAGARRLERVGIVVRKAGKRAAGRNHRLQPPGGAQDEVAVTDKPADMRRGAASGIARACERGCLGCLSLCHGAIRLCASLVVLLAIATGLLIYELRKNPVPLPGVATLAETAFNSRAGREADLEIGGAYLAVTRRGRPALRFRDVTARSRATGELVISVPRLGARFSVPDLIAGRVEPLGITVIEPAARLVRLEDGRFRFGLGFGAGVAPTEEAPADTQSASGEAGFGAVSKLLDAFAGLEPRPAGAERLRRVAIRDADLLIRNAATGGTYRAKGADFVLRIDETGIRADAVLPVKDRAGNSADIILSGRREAGTRDTRLEAGFTGLRLDALARELPEIAWLAPLGAPVSGQVSTVVHGDGSIGDIATSLDLAPGALALDDELPPIPFENARLVASYSPGEGRLALERFAFEGPQGRASIFGHVEVSGGPAGAVEQVAADLRLEDMMLDLPGVLAQPAVFESGALAFTADTGSGVLELADFLLARGDMVLQGAGSVALIEGADEPVTGLRITGSGLEVEDVKALWPIGAGGNARPWFVENILQGRLPEMVAHLQLGPWGEELALDFSFEDVASTYLATMPAIEGGYGQAHLTLDSFDLGLVSGHVDVGGAGRLDIAGSRIRIFDFDKPITPADVSLTAEGPIAAVLDLIDTQPLGLVSRLGLPLGRVAGQASVEAELAFPLLADLKVEEVYADARARLTGVAMALPLGEGEPIPIASPALSLAADTERLTLSGPVDAFGTRLTTVWDENYGAAPGRSLSLEGTVDRALIQRFGPALPLLGPEPFAMKASLEQVGDEAPRLSLETDLTPVSIDPPVAWSKAAGSPGSLALSGSLGEELQFDRVALEASGLRLEGSVSFGANGRLKALNVPTLVIGDLVDVTVAAEPDGAGGLAMRLGGRKLDAALADAGAGGEDDGASLPEDGPFADVPIAIRFDLDRLALAEGIAVSPAAGNIRHEPASGIRMDFAGRLNASAPASGTLDLPAEGDGRITLRSDDAGAFLRALDLASEAQGGTLAIDATVKDGNFDRIEGRAEAERLQLTEGSTVQRIFVEGGAAEVLEADGKVGGVSFRQIEVPFRFGDGAIVVTDAVATGPALAIRIGGRIDQEAGTVAMSGVASPAYAVSGFLNNIPVLGRVLTGDRGEGLLGLTFTVTGALEDPDISVNPLSLLAPGILRDVFESDPAERSGGKRGEERPPRLIDDFGPRN